jgi:pimeloyl-ACP methyl ester carboxylesterase
MSKYIWINPNPSFKNFHQPLLRALSYQVPIDFWEYHQTVDEGGSMILAINLLHQYLSQFPNQPIHLIGHGLGGAVALEYAHQYSDTVSSVVCLGVSAQPAIDWQYLYYQQLQSACMSRRCILELVAAYLLPAGSCHHISSLANKLDRDLLESPSAHSLWSQPMLTAGSIAAPLLVGHSVDDVVTYFDESCQWQQYCKPRDVLYQQPSGGHFFHYFHPQPVAKAIWQFWSSLQPTAYATAWSVPEVHYPA